MSLETSITVDITPHPRILSILKDIEFTMLQCFCELVDNSIDGFLDALRSGTSIEEPTVTLGINKDTISIHDNGPGMSLERLERAVSAGWTSKDGTSSLGLYGMGFNIASAKLGGVTTIWTTRSGDKEWRGVRIDLGALARGSSYQLPVLQRFKSDASYSGTEIEITSVKAEWADKFTASTIKKNLTDPLGRIYKSMLREQAPHPIRFKLRVNGINVPAWEHCVWPETKTVDMKATGEIIRATESFDRVFGTKYRSRATGDVFDSPEGHDPADLIEFEERVHGWIGVQRYLDSNDYGIDIIRNGRVIEMASKDLFYWTEEDGSRRKEYPIDDPRDRGRIVGEIHLDHGYVFYTKKNFEHDHYSWGHLLTTVLHNGALTKREDKSQNKSPLGKVFRAFRRSSPQRPQTYSDILVVKDNEKAKVGAQGYRKGEALYRDMPWWEEQLAISDREEAPPTPDTPSVDIMGLGTSGTPQDPSTLVSGGSTGGTLPSVVTPSSTSAAAGGTPAVTLTPGPAPLKRDRLPDLDMRTTGPGSERIYKATVYRVHGAGQELSLRGKPSASGIFEIELNTGHPVFQSSSFRVVDAVLAEFAFHVTDEENNRGPAAQVSFSEVLTTLRAQYRGDHSLDPNRLSLDTTELMLRVQEALTKTLDAKQQEELLALLTPESANRIQLAQVRHPSPKPVSSLINIHDLSRIFQQRPEVVMAAGCFKAPWQPDALALNPTLLAQHQEETRRRIGGVLDSLSGFSPNQEEAGSTTTLAYMRAALDVFRELLA